MFSIIQRWKILTGASLDWVNSSEICIRIAANRKMGVEGRLVPEELFIFTNENGWLPCSLKLRPSHATKFAGTSRRCETYSLEAHGSRYLLLCVSDHFFAYPTESSFLGCLNLG